MPNKKNNKNVKINLKNNSSVKFQNNTLFISEALSVNDLSNIIKKNSVDIIKFFFLQKKIVNKNQILDPELISEVCHHFGINFKFDKQLNLDNMADELKVNDRPDTLEDAPPIVTIMGHVDHGKTTLLDAIRKTETVSREFGGITQHIGAYQVTHNSKKITFIDTPGHEAFTQMRAQGSKVTNIVVLVVAADDGVKPQTIEAIDHAKAANAPIIVFVNKIDKPGVKVEKVMQELSKHELIPESWGGKTIFIEGSAKQKIGLDNLLEAILLLAEINEVKANYNRSANGVVLESHLDRSAGAVASILVLGGTLHDRDIIVAGSSWGKIKKITNDFGKTIKTAVPSTPVQVLGLDIIPAAGSKFIVIKDQKSAKNMAASFGTREKLKLNKTIVKELPTLELLSKKINSSDDNKTLKIIIKSDKNGSIAAIEKMLNDIKSDDIKLTILRSSVGAITESDINLASVSDAIIFGFNVFLPTNVKNLGDENDVPIILHNIIYKLVDNVKALMLGLLEPTFIEKETGEATIQKLFSFSKIGNIAGCLVTKGLISRNDKIKVLRDSKVIFDGEINTIQREKNPVKSVKLGQECGITIKNFNDIQENDTLQSYKLVKDASRTDMEI